MKIRLWGTRGSIPAPGPSTARYGGNTSCVEVRLEDGSLIILDAGSGIRSLGATMDSCDGILLLSHYHWDHIQGAPFFAPAYSEKSNLRIIGPEFNGAGPQQLLCDQMLAPYFPAPASDWHGVRSFETIHPGDGFSVGGAVIRTARLCHPSTTLAYRIEQDGQSLVYASDNEPGAAGPQLLSDLIELGRGADLLLHDCQYTESEYDCRRGWGHSTPAQAAGVANAAEVRKLITFHHDPSHGDEQVEALAEEAQAFSRGIEVFIAREGQTYEVSSAKTATVVQ
jgi:phosphoribosyl 1,2-cyclic phosphodiesterase